MTSQDIKNEVLKKIRSHEVVMKPRIYFTLRVVAASLLSLGILTFSILVFNFISFALRMSLSDIPGPWDGGIGFFLQAFPWVFLSIDIALIAALSALLKQFRFGYSIPTLHLVCAVVLVTVVVGTALDRGTPLNDRLLERDNAHHLPPPFDGLYRGVHHRPPQPREEIILIPR